MTTAAGEAVHQPECGDPADPLSRYSVISLFPRTLGILRDAPRPYDLDRDLDSLHDHLTSAALRNPTLLVEQARDILAKKSEILNDDDIGKRKRRRPGLPSRVRGQRPRFSLKPDFTCQSAVDLLANLEFNVDKYEDPDEFFNAYDMFETTKRELEKLAGVLPDPNQQSIVGNGRPRRPGLSRSRVSYDHLFKNITVSPQKKCQDDAMSTESPSSALQPERVESSKLMESAGCNGAENKASGPSDDVFSSILEDLDIDGADVVNVLQERLQIKTFDVKCLHFPEMQELQHNEVKTPRSDSSKPRQAYLQNILNSQHSKSPSKHGVVRSQLSPTPLRRPLSVMNSLTLAEVSSSIDPVSPKNFEEPVEEISPANMHSETKSPIAKRGYYSDFAAKSRLRLPEEVGDPLRDIPQTENCAEKTGDITGKENCCYYGGEESDVNIGSSLKNTEKFDDITCLAGNNSKGSCSMNEGASVDLREKSVDVGDTDTEIAVTGAVSSSNVEESDVNVDLSQMEAHIESPTQRLSKEFRKPIQSPTANVGGHLAKDKVKKKKTLTKGRKGKQHGGRKRTADSRGQTSAADQNLSVPENTARGKGPLNSDGREEVLSEEPVADQKQGDRPRKVRRWEELNRRQSLAAAGTSWSGGVRRSTRIKSRPLEYWRGERFLYGRVHQTLATVIGIKYESPGKADGKSTFRVKSFVSDQYKDLVDLVALH
ncbi:hypothetical protein MLD38_004170 [Melastoma candidum]|uniref:Uncharacterized protein n=1 Tax=Melastoma candidum TaxID=119954 RepID=A0ACB9S4Z5_9MYRT|nr:hypothetical protein MLD38_004170 [Melastoma candidum]